MLVRLTMRVLGASFLASMVTVLGMTLTTVASAREEHPPCPPCNPITLTCDGADCRCVQTGVGTGEFQCILPNDIPPVAR